MISIEAKVMMKIFTMLKKLEILSKDEEFNMFYVWIEQVEEYADEHKL